MHQRFLTMMLLDMEAHLDRHGVLEDMSDLSDEVLVGADSSLKISLKCVAM